MNLQEIYILSIQGIKSGTYSEIADYVMVTYPEVKESKRTITRGENLGYERSDSEIKTQITKELAGRFGANTSEPRVEVNNGEVIYIGDEEIVGIEEDRPPRKHEREVRINEDKEVLSSKEEYRCDEIYAVSAAFKRLLNIAFNIDHAKAIMNPEERGHHHPDNLHLLDPRFNRIKSNENMVRKTWEQQECHIRKVIAVYEDDMVIDIEVVDMLIARLKSVY